jgi:radical SAM superfamily enzyme YgiQ (UPF0313 family)
MDSDLGVYLSCNIRADSYKRFAKKTFAKMRKAGFIEFLIGIESGSNAILKRLGKGITFEDSIKTLSILKKIENIPFVRSYWMIGVPGETHHTLSQTLKKLNWLYEKKLIYDSVERIFIPYPGLEMFRKPSKYGLEILTTDWRRYKRFSFPPVHRLKGLNEFELSNYILVMKSIQLKHYAKWAGLQQELYEYFWDKSEKHFISVVPP